MALRSAEAPPGYQTMAEVVEIQDNLLDLISGGRRSGSKDSKVLEAVVRQVKEKEKLQLQNLLAMYQQKENELLSIIDIPGTTTQQKLNNLAKRIKRWNSSGAKELLNNSDAIAKKIAMLIQPASFLELEKLLEEVAELNPTLLADTLFGEEIQDFTISQAQEVAQAVVKSFGGNDSRRGTLSVTFSGKTQTGSGKSGKGKYTTNLTMRKGITVRAINNNNSIRVSLTGDMNNETRNDLAAALEKIIQENAQEASGSIRSMNSRLQYARDQIFTLINSMLPDGVKPRTRNKINDVVNRYVLGRQDITLSGNKNVVKGALGEIYWTAFFENLGLKTEPVGYKYLGDSAQLPVDIVVENLFGFQVKNYSTTEVNGDLMVYFNRGTRYDEVTNSVIQEAGSVPLTTFFSKIPSSNPQLFGSFFFSEAYNKENDEFDGHEKFRPVEQRFSTIRNEITTYIEANAYTLLNMSREVKNITDRAKKAVTIPKTTLTTPVVYLINDNFFPISYMIQDMIDSLEESVDETAISIKVQDAYVNTHSLENLWPTSPEESPKTYIANCTVSYYIEVNLSRLFNRIFKKKK